MKRIIPLLLALFLIPIALLSCGEKEYEPIDFNYTKAELVSEGLRFGNYIYNEYADNSAMLTGYEGDESTLSLPQTVNGLTVTSIGRDFMCQSKTLTSITLPDSVTWISGGALADCPLLSEVKLGKNIEYIGEFALTGTPYYASLTDEFVTVGRGVLIKYNGTEDEIVIPDGVCSVSTPFSQSETLRRVTLSDTVVSIAEHAFAGCYKLYAIDLGQSLKYIGNGAFSNCIGLMDIDAPESLEYIAEAAFYSCEQLRWAMVPGAEYIGPSAFEYCNQLRLVGIGARLSALGYNSFAGTPNIYGVHFWGSDEEFSSIPFGEGSEVLQRAPRKNVGTLAPKPEK